MSVYELRLGGWYRYHGTPALYIGRANGQFIFEITTARGTLAVRVGARRLKTEITRI